MGLVLYLVLGVLVGLFWFGLIGGFAGAIAGRGREDRTLLANAGIGLLGSLIGGTLWTVVAEGDLRLSFGGFIASIIGAVVLLLVVEAARRRRTTPAA